MPVNYAKAEDIFDFNKQATNADIDLQEVVDLLENSPVGRETLKQLKEKGVKPYIDYTKKPFTHRGSQYENNIEIYMNNISSPKVAAQTVIHETTHLFYGIGQSQWAEAVCMSREKMFLTGKPLTISEKRYIINLTKGNYPEFKWKKRRK